MTSKELRHKLTQGQGKEIGGALQGCHQAGVWWVVRTGVQAVHGGAECQQSLQKLLRALQPHHTQASEQLGRTYTAHCNTLFIEIAKTDKCSGTVILFAHRVFILYIF